MGLAARDVADRGMVKDKIASSRRRGVLLSENDSAGGIVALRDRNFRVAREIRPEMNKHGAKTYLGASQLLRRSGCRTVQMDDLPSTFNTSQDESATLARRPVPVQLEMEKALSQ